MERTLGRIWQGESDTFTFLLNIEEEADKKRKIVISVANIFDPMVFLACCHFQDSRLAAVKEGKGWKGRLPWEAELPKDGKLSPKNYSHDNYLRNNEGNGTEERTKKIMVLRTVTSVQFRTRGNKDVLPTRSKSRLFLDNPKRG
jgi:hypothetical protein